jgi:hypothetical protein
MSLRMSFKHNEHRIWQQKCTHIAEKSYGADTTGN